jgi:hypothetical protein
MKGKNRSLAYRIVELVTGKRYRLPHTNQTYDILSNPSHEAVRRGLA